MSIWVIIIEGRYLLVLFPNSLITSDIAWNYISAEAVMNFYAKVFGRTLLTKPIIFLETQKHYFRNGNNLETI